MKKILFFGALVAMLLGTAACSSDMEPTMGDDMVRFTIELPGNIDSRAISDGLTANKLTVAVYDEQGNELPDIRVNKDIPHQTTVEFKLVKGQKYSFAFWAQAQGAPYTFDTAAKTVTVNYENAKSNDETRDAFYAYRADLTVTGPMSETIYLYRPFCQLNYGASDYADAIKAGVNATKSAVTVKNAATTFNLATGESTGSTEVTFTKEILPNDPATLTVEEKAYQWMAMNYFLVPNNQANIETSLQLYEGDAETAVRDITVPNVPVQKNHRTNIVGNLFTEDVNFLVIIDERFDQPDFNVELMTAAEAIEAMQVPGATVNLAPGTVLTIDLSKIAEGVTLNGNGSTMQFAEAVAQQHSVINDNITIDGFQISNENNPGSAIYVKTPNFTLKNCEFIGYALYRGADGWNRADEIQMTNGAPDGVILIENCSLEAPYTFKAMMPNGSTATSKVIIRDCEIDAIYPINCNGSQGDMLVENSTLNGWTSWDNGAGHTATFNNCEFGKGAAGYATVRPYQTSYFNNCTFSSDITFEPRNASESFAEGCTFDDLTHFFTVDSTELTAGVGCSITINGIKYFRIEGDPEWKM